MPKLVSSRELDQIVEAVGRHPGGVGSEALLQALGNPAGDATGRRTLQRRLALLLKAGRIEAGGAGRATRYSLPPTSANTPEYAYPLKVSEPAAEQPQAGIPVTLSPEAAELRTRIRRPRLQREPVGYQLAFLENYHPNVTAYLPESLRGQLHLMGRSPGEPAPAGTFARDILNRLLIDLSWASCRLEGNTYSRLDTERLIELGQAADGKDALETQMILNHKAAIEFLVHGAVHMDITPASITALHALLSDGLMPDPAACGRLRTRPVEIGGSVYLPLGFPQQLAELFGLTLELAAEIRDPFEQAFFLMVHLPYLQPFEDVNKRVSRLAANIPLIRHNLCPLSFIDVPQPLYVDSLLAVYEMNRVELLRDVFASAYERSCQQYVAVKQHLVPPDIFRLRHRVPLSETVAALVRNLEPATETAIAARMPVAMPEDERPRFIALVMQEFRSLHAGNAIRFGLHALEFEAWKGRQSG